MVTVRFGAGGFGWEPNSSIPLMDQAGGGVEKVVLPQPWLMRVKTD